MRVDSTPQMEILGVSYTLFREIKSQGNNDYSIFFNPTIYKNT